jgi:hypothetical protein
MKTEVSKDASRGAGHVVLVACPTCDTMSLLVFCAIGIQRKNTPGRWICLDNKENYWRFLTTKDKTQ